MYHDGSIVVEREKLIDGWRVAKVADCTKDRQECISLSKSCHWRAEKR